MKHKRLLLLIASTLVMMTSRVYSAPSPSQDQLIQQIENSLCENGESLAALFAKRAHSPSQRDLGWRIFQDDDQTKIYERAFLINKGMELRYRWSKSMENSYKAANDRAVQLCGTAKQQSDSAH